MNFSHYPSFADLVKLVEERRRDIFISLIIGVILESGWFFTTTNTFLILDLSKPNHLFIGAVIIIVHLGLAPLIFLCGILLLLSFIIRRKDLEEKEKILSQVQQKLGLLEFLSKEIKRNNDLRVELISSEASFRKILSMNLSSFLKDYALEVTKIGYFTTEFTETIDAYIQRINELNDQKKILIEWVVSSRQLHIANTNKFYKLLRESEQLFNEIVQEVNKQIEICKEKMT